MKLYLIGGLGADKRVFEELDLKGATQVMEWVSPTLEESLPDYVQRLLPQIDTNEAFALLGVSFGGIIALELAKKINPTLIFLISSVVTADQLPQNYVKIGQTGVLNAIPDALIKPPNFLLGY